MLTMIKMILVKKISRRHSTGTEKAATAAAE
jgi:hypothetical protein